MSNKRKVILLPILLIALFLIGVGIYMYFNSSKMIFAKAIKKASDNLLEVSNNLVGEPEYDTMKLSTNTNFSITDSQSQVSLLFYGNLGYNNKNKKTNMNLSWNLNNQKLMDLEAILDKDKLHFKIKDMMKQFYYVDTKIDSSEEITIEDIEYIVNYAKNSLFNNLNNKDFTKSKQTLNLDDKSISTTKVTLQLNQDKYNKICIDLLTKIKNDKKAMSIIQKMYPELTEQIITDTIDELKDEEISKDMSVSYTIYVDKNNDILKQQLVINNEGSILNNKLIEMVNYKNSNNYSNLEMTIYDNNDINLMSLKLIQTSDSEKKLSVESSLINLSGILKFTDKESTWNIDAYDDNNNKIGLVTYALKKVKNDEYTVDFSANISILETTFKLINKNIITLNEDIIDIEVGDSKIIDTMPESEQNLIFDTIINRLTKIVQ